MIFTNPFLLSGLIAVGIPIAIHLLFREKPRPVDIPTVEFIRRAALKSQRRRRVTERLLLLSRVLIVALLVLAVARPIWRNSPFYQATTGQAALVIVIDDSFYTAQTVDRMRLIEHAHALGQKCVDRLAVGSKATCFTTSQTTDQLTADLEFVRRLVDQTTPQNGRGDLRRAIRQAGALLNRDAGELQKTIVVISDLNRGIRGGDEPLPTIDGCRLVLLKLPQRSDNVYIREAALDRPEDIVVNRPARLRCRLGGGDRLNGQRLVLEINGKQVQQTTIDRVDGVGTARAEFDVELSDPGFATARLYVDTVDGLAGDNEWQSAMHVSAPSKVLCVGNSGGGVQLRDLLAAAIAPPGWYGRQRYLIDLANDEYGWQERHLASYELVILTGRCGLPNTAWLRIQEYLRNGGSVLIMPDATTDLDRLNAGALPMLPAEIMLQSNASRPAIMTAADGAGLGKVLLSLGKGELKDIGFTAYYHTAASDDASVELVAEEGQAVLASRQIGEGRLIFCGLSLEPEWSPLVRRDVFAPMIHAILGNFQNSAIDRYSAVCGEPVRIPPLASARADGASIRLSGSDNQVHLAAADFADGPALFTQTSKPGIYTVAPEAPDAFQFAANVRRTDATYEYDLTEAALAHNGAGSSVAEILAESTAERGPAPLNPIVLCLLVLLLTAETWLGLAHRRHA
jgi:hypothetical protein